MPPMHDDDLPADPRIPQNRGARRGQEPDAATGFYRIGSGREGHQAGYDAICGGAG